MTNKPTLTTKEAGSQQGTSEDGEFERLLPMHVVPSDNHQGALS